MSLLLKILVILSGVFLIYSVMKTMKQKKMSAAQSLLWLLAGFLIIILGIFPVIIHWVAQLFGVVWQPAIVFLAAIVILAFICFNHTKQISVMRAEITELAEQVSVLKHELREKEILKEEVREE